MIKQKWIRGSVLLLALLLLVGCTASNTPNQPSAAQTPAQTPSSAKVRDVQTNTPQAGSTISPFAPPPSPASTPSGTAYPNSMYYKNTEYGFTFRLPQTWNGYKIITTKWEGVTADSTSQKTVQTGPILSIRHPLWTEKKPRQDIPIMVFTLDQWDSLQKDEFHIGAAPIGPTELGRNNKYVFALPARYNFAFPEGYEEVEVIVNGKPLQPTPVSE